MNMSNRDLLNILCSYPVPTDQIDFDSLAAPPWYCYINPMDVEYLRQIALSRKYNGNIDKKLKIIRQLMERNGWKRFSGGTNRVIYFYPDDPSVVCKVAIDRVGIEDNYKELKNQELLKPFCAKMFSVSPCGTIGIAERVIPCLRREEFQQIAGDVFEVLYGFTQKYLLEDAGTDYFKNWGIAPRIGPVLLDYTDVYPIDYNKLTCNNINPITGNRCGGFIDYDDGINHLYCNKCGKKYEASTLQKDIKANNIIPFSGKKGGKIVNAFILEKGEIRDLGNGTQSYQVTDVSKTEPVRSSYFSGSLADIVAREIEARKEVPAKTYDSDYDSDNDYDDVVAEEEISVAKIEFEEIREEEEEQPSEESLVKPYYLNDNAVEVNDNKVSPIHDKGTVDLNKIITASVAVAANGDIASPNEVLTTEFNGLDKYRSMNVKSTFIE